MAKEPQRLMAIWEYDHFPFMCFGEIERVNDDGTIQAWQNNRFKPFKILPYEKGLEIKKAVEDLKDQYRKDISKFYKDQYMKLQSIFPTDHVAKIIAKE